MSSSREKLFGLLAEYESPGALVSAAKKVREAGYAKWDCYSPFPVHGIDPAMGIRWTILPMLVFFGGLTGCAGGILLQWWANAYNWPWIISGKPFFSLPAQIPITFELTVLLSAFTAFFGMWALNKLPQVWHPLFLKDRFLKVTDDGFFVGIEADDDNFDAAETEKLLRDAGAVAVEQCRYQTGPEKTRVPKEVLAFILITAMLGTLPLAFIIKSSYGKSRDPHFHVIPNMDFQPKLRAQAPAKGLEMFEDGRASRVPPEGAVARGEAFVDDHLYRGLDGAGQWATTFPGGLKLDESAMARGEQRFGIFCTPCHSQNGDGAKGLIHQRALAVGAGGTGWNQPTNLSDVAVVKQPHGQLFYTISNGIRTMPGYASQISAEDRWYIVLYLRALQRSRRTVESDLDPTTQQRLQ